MFKRKKQRDYRSIWLLCMLLLIIGIVLTFRPSLLRALGFTLLGLGGIGVVWALIRMDKKDKDDGDDYEIIP